MDPRASLQVYPRKDSVFKQKSSFNFEIMRSKIFIKRQAGRSQRLYRWLAHFLAGMVTGTIAFLMATVEEYLTAIRSDYTQELIQEYSWFASFSFYAGFAIFCTLIAGAMTVYIGPGANGSGVAEIMGLLNGVNYPKVISIRTLIVKIVAVVLAVVGSLCVGKEGPLAHIGTVTTMLIIYMPLEGFKFFQNDHDKRTFIAAGAAAGVSAAFGSPIGGALFAYEISKPTTFWTFRTLWLVFFTSAVSTLTLAFLTNMLKGNVISLSGAAVLKFGNLTQLYSPLNDLPAALIIGSITGMMGALLVTVQARLGVLRKRFVNTNIKKVLEVCLFAFATSACFFLVALSSKTCVDLPAKENGRELFQFTCPENQYSPLATLLLNTEGGTIRSVMDYQLKLTISDSIIFTAIWYFFFVITYGVWVPSGVFLPGIIIGCGLGQIYGQIFENLFPDAVPNTEQSYKIQGATAVLAGYTRLTYSLCVIMLETTQSINFFIPIMISVLVSVLVGDSFNRSIYERALRAKQIPLLRNNCPESCKDVTAYQIMSHNPVTVEGIIAVEHLIELLQKPFSSFPVLNSAGNIVGIISKNFIIKLIELKHFVDVSKLDIEQKSKLPKVFRRSTSNLELRPPLKAQESEPFPSFYGDQRPEENDGPQESNKKGEADGRLQTASQEPDQRRVDSEQRTESINIDPMRAESFAVKEVSGNAQ